MTQMTINYVDSLDLSVPDVFVVRENKTGKGNGEAKLYVGSRISSRYRTFFGPPGFRIKARMKKSHLLQFLDEIRIEYEQPSHEYRSKKTLGKIWKSRKKLVQSLPTEDIYFFLEEQSHLQGNRGYVNSSDDAFQLLRELPLPNSSRMKILKVKENGHEIFEFRLIPDITNFGSTPIEVELQEEIQRISSQKGKRSKILTTTVERLTKVRIGQGRFRRDVLDDCDSRCPFTNVSDEGLLTAGHLKRWEHSTPAEQLDPQNGLVFTPTYDRLVNDGLISFEDDGKLIISPLLSKETCQALGLTAGMIVNIPITGRKNAARRLYLKHHREKVFKS